MEKNDAISRIGLLEDLGASCYDLNALTGITGDERTLQEAILQFPALDVAPVIYCKDCIYARPLNLRELMVFDSDCFVCTSRYGAGSSYPEYEMTGKVVFPKSFCSYAHRRTNGR